MSHVRYNNTNTYNNHIIIQSFSIKYEARLSLRVHIPKAHIGICIAFYGEQIHRSRKPGLTWIWFL